MRHVVAGLEPAVLGEGLGVRLVVVEVLEEQLDAAGAAHPELADLARRADLPGVVVDDEELVAGRRSTHRAVGVVLVEVVAGGVDDRLGHAPARRELEAEPALDHRHRQPEHADPDGVLRHRLVGDALEHERDHRDVGDPVALRPPPRTATPSTSAAARRCAPTPRVDQIDQLCALTWKNGRYTR